MSLLAEKTKQPVELGLLEDDDEFEEFPAEGEFSYNLTWLKIDLSSFTLSCQNY